MAIGNNLKEALNNLLSQSAVKIKIESTESIEDLIQTIIDANNNLKESTSSKDFEMIGKDITKLQSLIDELEQRKIKEAMKLKNEEENKKSENKIENSIE